MSRTHSCTADSCNKKVTGVNPTVPFWILDLALASFFFSLEASLKKGMVDSLCEFERWKNSNSGSKEWGTTDWLVTAESWTLSSWFQQLIQDFHMAVSQRVPALCPICFHLYAQTRNSRLILLLRGCVFQIHKPVAQVSHILLLLSSSSPNLALLFLFLHFSRDTGTLFLAHTTDKCSVECKHTGAESCRALW